MQVDYRKAAKEDIEGILFVETNCFRTPWSKESFEFDICENDYALYIVACKKGRIVGFCGMHSVFDEGHIMNVAVLEEYRGNGIGERLLLNMFGQADECVDKYTLEVRTSNSAAIHLYEKLGFKSVSVHPKYYSDTHEDASIMWKSKT